QAEDGIRDRNVTGVQTCALPISVRWVTRRRTRSAPHRWVRGARLVDPCQGWDTGWGSARCGALDVVVLGVLEPGEHLAQLAAGGLDRVLLLLGAQLLELRRARGLVVHEALSERAVLD